MMSTCFSTASGGTALFQDFDQVAATVQLRCEALSRSSRTGRTQQFSVLRQIQAERACHLPHGLHLRATADAADREADVDGRAHIRVEQIGLQVNLAVVIEITLVGI
jgi:hypothetical protein